MANPTTYKAFGARAILIEWNAKIAPEILESIRQFRTLLLEVLRKDLQDVIIGYHSLTLVYHQPITDFEREIRFLKQKYQNLDHSQAKPGNCWEIPVCYDPSLGVDLIDLSQSLGLSTETIIAKHSAVTYDVYFIGFLPGFLYLGGLDAALHIPRKATPRLQVPQGSVAIGGQQTGIYPSESAGGWHIIGRTPTRFFDIERDPPCFAQSGDQIRFRPIDLETWYRYER